MVATKKTTKKMMRGEKREANESTQIVFENMLCLKV